MNAPSAVVSRADAVAAAALCDCLNASFADYLISLPVLDGDGWRAFVRRQGCDLSQSLAACRGDVVTAFALVTPRSGGRTRIAVMGARPQERGTGVAARLLDQAIGAATARGDRSIELEVFAQNERAARLYRSRGFEPACSLYGFEAATAAGSEGDADCIEVSQEDAARWAIVFERDQTEALPWQVCGEAISCAPATAKAWRLGGAQLVFQEAESSVTVTSLLDRDAMYADGRRLLMLLRHRFPDGTLRALQLQRDDGPARAFAHAGWTRMALHQLLMRRALTSDGGAATPLASSGRG